MGFWKKESDYEKQLREGKERVDLLEVDSDVLRARKLRLIFDELNKGCTTTKEFKVRLRHYVNTGEDTKFERLANELNAEYKKERLDEITEEDLKKLETMWKMHKESKGKMLGYNQFK